MCVSLFHLYSYVNITTIQQNTVPIEEAMNPRKGSTVAIVLRQHTAKKVTRLLRVYADVCTLVSLPYIQLSPSLSLSLCLATISLSLSLVALPSFSAEHAARVGTVGDARTSICCADFSATRSSRSALTL